MTWLPISSDAATVDRKTVFGLLGEAGARLEELVDASWQVADVTLLEIAWARLAQLLECHRIAEHETIAGLPVENWRGSNEVSSRERAALRFVEQFVFDPGLCRGELSHELANHLSWQGAVNFAAAINAFEGY